MYLWEPKLDLNFSNSAALQGEDTTDTTDSCVQLSRYVSRYLYVSQLTISFASTAHISAWNDVTRHHLKKKLSQRVCEKHSNSRLSWKGKETQFSFLMPNCDPLEFCEVASMLYLNWFVKQSFPDLPVYLEGVPSLHLRSVTAASFFPLNYNETRLERGGDNVPWIDHAPCHPAASAQSETLERKTLGRKHCVKWKKNEAAFAVATITITRLFLKPVIHVCNAGKEKKSCRL